MNNKILKLANKFLDSKKKKDTSYRSDFSYYKYNKTLEKIFDKKDDKLFEKIIFANNQEIQEYIKIYKEYLEKNNLEFKSIEKLIKEKKNNKLLKELLSLHNSYDSFSKDWNYKIIETLDIQTCLYCNREGILTFTNKNNSIQTTAEIDHFYPRSLYPFLSISFFNLIPSCKTCNSKFKGDNDTYIEKLLYPYEDDFNQRAKFTHFFNNLNEENKYYAIFSKERITLDLKPIDDKDIRTENTIKTFRLNELYNEHKDIVLELIQKQAIYNESYIDELMTQYEGTFFKNREDLLRLITCGYITDEEIGKRPLSKLIKDISTELELT